MAATVLLSATGCSSAATASPENTIDMFVTSLHDLELENANNYLSDVLQETIAISISERSETLTESDVEKLDGYDLLESKFKEISKGSSHKIDSSGISDDKAEIKLSITYEDISSPVSKAFKASLSKAFDEKMTEEENIENTFSEMNKELKDFEPESKTIEGDIVLEKEDGEWVISEIDSEILNGFTNGVLSGFEKAISNAE